MPRPPRPLNRCLAFLAGLACAALARAGENPAILTQGQMANPNGHYFAGYFPTWSDPWFSASNADGSLKTDDQIYAASQFAQLPGVYTHAMVAFAQPDFSWAGLAADTWTGTGVQFQSTPANIKQAIRILHQLGKRVLLSVGGATYLDWTGLAQEAGRTGTPIKTALAACLADLGLDGLDVDYEVGGADPATVAQYVGAIQALREAADAAGPGHLLSIAGWSTGADYTPATPIDAGYPGSFTYWGGNAGRERLAFKAAVPSGPRKGQLVAGLFDLVDVMSYDAQTSDYDPVTAFSEYRFLVPGTVPVSLGLEIPPEGWPGGILVIADSQAGAPGTIVVADQYGRTPRGPYSVQRSGGFVLANKATPNPHDGLMLWDTGLTSSIPAGACPSANATTVAAEVAALFGYVPMPPSASVTVAVTPSSCALLPGGTQAFKAQVLGAGNTAVAWSGTGGTISSAGLYKAGSALGSFTVTATAAADATKKASAAVTIAASLPVTVAIAPAAVTLAPGAGQQFSALVTGSADTAVTWSCTGGSITPAGLYKAGAASGAFSVTAASAADPTRKATAAVTVRAPSSVSVTIVPASVTLSPGATAQFKATVTGSADQTVAWYCTGGSIWASGLYQAGTTPGTFTVTASPVADRNRSATATVTIKAL